MSALEAASAMARGLKSRLPAARLDLMPVSDGGDGLLEVLLNRHGGRLVRLRVRDALGRPRRAGYAVLKDGRAVVEMARASGIAGLPRSALDPLQASSYGTGQLIAHALRRGCREILVGMGGSASNDGGSGMAAALGARLLDAAGRELPLGALPLLRLARIDARPLRRLLGRARVVALSDVRNPLLGPRGSARVYGPQKGATPAMVEVLERALARYGALLRKDLGRAVSGLPGSGAAGGLGAGLSAFLGAKLKPGAEWVLRDLGAAARLRRADWAVTGEGRLDEQSFYGKAPIALARLARRAGARTLFICGTAAPAARARLKRLGPCLALSRPGESPEAAMRRTARRLETLDWSSFLSDAG